MSTVRYNKGKDLPGKLEKINVNLKFSCWEAKISLKGLIDPEKRFSQSFADLKPHLTAKRPFVVKEKQFKVLLVHLRLTDTEVTATRSCRQIEGIPFALQ